MEKIYLRRGIESGQLIDQKGIQLYERIVIWLGEQVAGPKLVYKQNAPVHLNCNKILRGKR